MTPQPLSTTPLLLIGPSEVVEAKAITLMYDNKMSDTLLSFFDCKNKSFLEIESFLFGKSNLIKDPNCIIHLKNADFICSTMQDKINSFLKENVGSVLIFSSPKPALEKLHKILI